MKKDNPTDTNTGFTELFNKYFKAPTKKGFSKQL